MNDARRTVLRAIRAADLGLLMPRSGGRSPKCVICGREVREEEFGGFVKTKAGPVVFCEQSECRGAVMRWRQG